MNRINDRQNLGETASMSTAMTEQIFINGSAIGAGAHNWTWVQYQPWFRGGTGVWNDPFILENLIFNYTNEDYMIEIINSDVFFEIQNCTFIESSENYAFYLADVNNSRIINNDIICNNPKYYNSVYNMYLVDCYNFTILENNISDSNGIQIEDCNTGFIQNNSLYSGRYNHDGLLISNCDNITISHNSFSTFDIGININSGKNITILNNTVSDCLFNGINLFECNNVNIIENYLNQNLDCYDTMILISDSNNISITSNNISINNDEIGIGCHYLRLEGDENAIFSTKIQGNVINGKPLISYINTKNLSPYNFSKECEVFLINCSYSSLSNLNTSKGGIGISLYYCNNITMHSISSTENAGEGLYLVGCSNITILNSTFSFNKEYGINILYSYQIELINNEINYNFGYGIILLNTDYCVIESNIIKGNYYYGVTIYNSRYNKFYFNIILDNYLGCVSPYGMDNNEFIGNVCDDKEKEFYSMDPTMVFVIFLVLFNGIFSLIVIMRYMNKNFEKELKYIIEKAKR